MTRFSGLVTRNGTCYFYDRKELLSKIRNTTVITSELVRSLAVASVGIRDAQRLCPPSGVHLERNAVVLVHLFDVEKFRITCRISSFSGV